LIMLSNRYIVRAIRADIPVLHRGPNTTTPHTPRTLPHFERSGRRVGCGIDDNT